MVRWIILAVLVVVVAAAVPLAMNYLPADVAGPVPSARADERAGPPPLLAVDETTSHDFGMMSEQDTGTRTWVVRNDGEGPLQLRFIEKPCTCTGVRLGEGGESLTEGQTLDIAPGEQAELAVAWETRDKIGQFSTYARFATNDYERNPTVTFSVKGLVTPAVVVDPPRLDFPAVPSDEEVSLSAVLYSPTRPGLALETGVRTSRPDLLVAEARPLTPEELEEYNKARVEQALGHSHAPGEEAHDHDHGHDADVPPVLGGHLVTVTLKPGLPLGRFADAVTIKTDHPVRPQVEIPIAGQIVGPIAAMPERVYLPGVDSRQGRSTSVTLNVRNQDRTTFNVRIPDALKDVVEASVEPVPSQAEGAPFRQYRLEIRVPRGARSGIHKGVLVLETDHPQAAEVKLPVEVLVRGG